MVLKQGHPLLLFAKAKLRERLVELRAGVIEGARQARLAYGEETRRARVSREPAARPSIDPKIAGYYANLEVEVGSDLETVTRAWKRLAREYHPDRHAGDAQRQAMATRLVQDLNHAYAELVRYLEAKPRK